MKKIIFYISIGLLVVNFIPKDQVSKAINNTKTFYGLVKSSDTKLPDVDVNQFGENLSKVQESINENFEMLDKLEKQNKEK